MSMNFDIVLCFVIRLLFLVLHLSDPLPRYCRPADRLSCFGFHGCGTGAALRLPQPAVVALISSVCLSQICNIFGTKLLQATSVKHFQRTINLKCICFKLCLRLKRICFNFEPRAVFETATPDCCTTFERQNSRSSGGYLWLTDLRHTFPYLGDPRNFAAWVCCYTKVRSRRHQYF